MAVRCTPVFPARAGLVVYRGDTVMATESVRVGAAHAGAEFVRKLLGADPSSE